MPVNEPTMKQIAAELLAAQEQSMAIVVAAMSRQMDAERLAADLRAQLLAAKKTGLTSSVAIRLATESLLAVEAEILLRKPARH